MWFLMYTVYSTVQYTLTSDATHARHSGSQVHPMSHRLGVLQDEEV